MSIWTDEEVPQRYTVWKCDVCGSTRHLTSHEFLSRPADIVAHDNTVDHELTQEEFALLREALSIAITCKEVEVDVAQAEADRCADTLRDLVVLQRKMEES